jgi:hypothetical protein
MSTGGRLHGLDRYAGKRLDGLHCMEQWMVKIACEGVCYGILGRLSVKTGCHMDLN